jgi:hypothetical protein
VPAAGRLRGVRRERPFGDLLFGHRDGLKVSLDPRVNFIGVVAQRRLDEPEVVPAARVVIAD